MQENQNLAAAEPTVGDSLYLPTLPPVVSRVIQATSLKDASIEEVAEIIEQDEPTTASILQVTNSSFYGLADPAATVAEGISVLGMKTVGALALAVSVVNEFWVEDSPGFNQRNFWYHCAACAIFAEAIVCEIAYDEAEKAFITGFIHDIGKIIILQNFPEQYQDSSHGVIALMKLKRIYQWKAEKEVFGFHHGDIGACLIEKWQLPPSYGEAIRYHHEPDQAENEKPLCYILRLSDAMSHFAFPFEKRERITPPLYHGLWEPLGLNEQIVRNLLNRREKTRERVDAFMDMVAQKTIQA